MTLIGAQIVDLGPGYCAIAMLTVEFKLNLLAPAGGERLLAEGHVVKAGRTLAITRGEVYAETGNQRTLVALMQQTLIVLHDKADG